MCDERDLRRTLGGERSLGNDPDQAVSQHQDGVDTDALADPDLTEYETLLSRPRGAQIWVDYGRDPEA